MDKFVIEGGRRLEGEVRAGGAKNSVLKLMAAAIMADGPCTILNVPDIADVWTMMEVIRYLGFEAVFSDGTLRISPACDPKLEAPYYLVRRMRASVEVLGPLLARFGRARVAMPGGCNIGSRQIDLHLRGLEQMGVRLDVFHGYIEAEAPRMTGAHLYLDFASMGATENLLMAGVLAKGRTVIENAAKEPEIADLVEFLCGMGARISGAGTSTLVVDGVPSLSGTEHAVIGDRVEAGTFLLAGAITRGELRVTGVNPEHLVILVEKMREAGCALEAGDDCLVVKAGGKLRGIEVSTLPYPGFPTDLQPQLLALLATVEGTSFITENIFDNRFMIVDELNRMGADIRTKDHHAIVHGVPELSGAPVIATDLRAGAAVVLAGLAAGGTTEVHEIHHIDRGYERFEEKLASVGAQIQRVSERE